MNPFFIGILVAFPMTLGIGPSLLLYFQATIKRGVIAGLAVLSGIWVSDIGFISVNYLGLSQFFNTPQNQRIASVVSASVLLVFGSVQLLRKPEPVARATAARAAPRIRSMVAQNFLSGFIVNSTNPMLLAYWMTLIGISIANFGFKTHPFYSFIAGIFIGEIICDTIKCIGFSRITVHFTPLIITWVNRIAGSAMMASGVVIACKSFI